jgi:beta-glucanase (GH16 family)
MKNLAILLLTIPMVKIVSGQMMLCPHQAQTVVLTQSGICNNNPWVLTFEDNFDGNSLDLSKWQIQPWGQGALKGENHQEYNSLDNATVGAGICKITAKHETVIRKAVNWKLDNEILSDGWPNLRTYYYTASNLWTHYKFGYGKYEIRCKLPKGKGFWPAFWMYGEKSGINNEIDVFEFWEDNTYQHLMNVHYNGKDDNHMCPSHYNGPDYSQDFHTFTVIWNDYKIEWYVDGSLKRRTTKFYTMLNQSVDCSGIHALNQYIMNTVFPKDPINIIISMGIQTGTYEPDGTTPFPSSLEIDYIRYYKQMQCTGAVTATDITQLNLSNEIYNLVIGTTITVSANFVVSNGQQLELVARDEIKLLPDLNAVTGSDFLARIDPTICAGMINANNSIIDKTSSSNSNDESTLITQDKDFKIKTYPNPNNGLLSLEFEQNSFENYQLYLMDEQGKMVYSLKQIKENKVEINMNGLVKGVYILNILDTKNKNAFVNKVIFN